MLRFKLGHLALAMVVIGVALAALVRATPPWVGVVYTASVAGFGVATIGGMFAHRRHRPFYAGTALAVLIYVVAAQSFPAPLELAPAWAIRTWVQGDGVLPNVAPFLSLTSKPMPTITTTTAVTPPPVSATSNTVVDTLLGVTPTPAATPAPAPTTAPLSIYITTNSGPATLQQAASSNTNTYDPTWIYASAISAITPPGWSRANAGLIAEMEAVWFVALAGGWVARRFAIAAEADDQAR